MISGSSRLHFDKDRDSARDKREDLFQPQNRLFRSLKLDLVDLFGIQLIELAAAIGEAVKFGIVKNEWKTVNARSHVQLDPVTGLDRRLESRAAILDPAPAMEAAVSERPSDQSLEPFFPIRL
jgi:hypothetical protein